MIRSCEVPGFDIHRRLQQLAKLLALLVAAILLAPAQPTRLILTDALDATVRRRHIRTQTHGLQTERD